MKHLVTFRMIDAIVRTGSIRSAAEQIAQTPSAVQRRLQSFEREVGVEIFERSSKGVRLTAAGELTILHIRDTLARTDRLCSQIGDLAGIRLGHVGIGCSQGLVPYFLPKQISDYQAQFSNVTFDVQILGHPAAGEALDNYEVDLVLVFDDQSVSQYDVRLAVPQRLSAIMSATHPLASQATVRLRACYDYPLALPHRGFGGRTLLERATLGKTFAKPPILESNSFDYLMAHVATTDAITFQIEIGAPGPTDRSDLVSRAIDSRDIEGGMLFLGQKRNRTLSVASSRFVEQVTKVLYERQFNTPLGSDNKAALDHQTHKAG